MLRYRSMYSTLEKKFSRTWLKCVEVTSFSTLFLRNIQMVNEVLNHEQPMYVTEWSESNGAKGLFFFQCTTNIIFSKFSFIWPQGISIFRRDWCKTPVIVQTPETHSHRSKHTTSQCGDQYCCNTSSSHSRHITVTQSRHGVAFPPAGNYEFQMK